MKYCSQCKIKIVSEDDRCPLCQNKVMRVIRENETSESAFPHIPDLTERYQFMLRIMVFLSFVVIVISCTINFLIPSKGWWSLFVVAAVICIWVSLGIAFKKRKNISKNIIWQMLLLSVISLLGDWFTGGRGWSINYVLPVLYMSVMLVLVVVNKVLKLAIEDYMVYTLLGGFFGIIPVLFLVSGILNNIYPSLFCVSGSIIFLSAILVFRGGDMIGELKRRFHW